MDFDHLLVHGQVIKSDDSSLLFWVNLVVTVSCCFILKDIISDIQTKGNLTLEDLGVFPTSVKPFLRQQLRIRDHSYIMPQHYRATRSDETSRPLLGVPFFILMFMFIYASRNTYSTRLKKPEKEQ